MLHRHPRLPLARRIAHAHPPRFKTAMFQLPDKTLDQTVKIRRIANDELNNQVEGIGALRLGKKPRALAFFPFKNRDLKDVIAPQFAGLKLETGMFVDHRLGLPRRGLRPLWEPHAVGVKRRQTRILIDTQPPDP